MTEDEMENIVEKLKECMALAYKGDNMFDCNPRSEIVFTLNNAIEQIKRYINLANEDNKEKANNE